MSGKNYGIKLKNHKLVICKLHFTINSMKRFYLFLLILTLLCHSNGLAQDNGVKKVKVEKEASEYDKANSEYLLIDAEKFILLEDYERALAALEQTLEVDAKNHAAYFKKAEILVTQKNFIRHLKMYKQPLVLIKPISIIMCLLHRSIKN